MLTGKCIDKLFPRVALGSIVATAMFTSAAYAVPIDLTDSTPTVTGATTMNFTGVLALGSSYWIDVAWDSGSNGFDVTGYGEESGKDTELFGHSEKVVTGFFGPVGSSVPIDLTDATPTVTGATTINITGIAALGSTYWADFAWSSSSNSFGVTGYGEDAGPVMDEFDFGEDMSSHGYMAGGETSIGAYTCDTQSQRVGSCGDGTGWCQITVAVKAGADEVTLTSRVPWYNTGASLYVDGELMDDRWGGYRCEWDETVLTDMAAATADGELDIKIADETAGCAGDLQITYMEIYSE